MAPMTLIYHLFHCCVKDLLSILLMHHWMTLSWSVMAARRLKTMQWCPRGNQLNYCPFTTAKPRPCRESLVWSSAHAICPVHCSGAPRLQEASHLHAVMCSAAPSALRSSARRSYAAASRLFGLPANEGEHRPAGAGGYIMVLQKKENRQRRKEGQEFGVVGDFSVGL